ncbi:MAG: EamA family transporter [Coriobacteriia bacterium]|nr:EamA family transporter [Coriobacteriia bacterium]
MRSSVFRGILMALAGAACWGFSATCASYLMTTFGMDVLWLASARMIIAGPLFLVAAVAFDRKRLAALFKSPRMLVHMVAFALVGVVALQITYMSGIQYLGAGTELLLQQTGLIVIMLVTCVRLKRLPHSMELIALVLAFAGTVCIATQGQVGQLGISAVGLLWGLASGLALAGSNVIPTTLLERHGSVVVNGVSMTLSAFILLPVARPVETCPAMPLEGWLAFAAIVLAGTLLAYALYLQGIKEAGPMRASLIAVFEPVSGMFFSAVWLHDFPTPFDLLGCACIVAMMILVAKHGE